MPIEYEIGSSVMYLTFVCHCSTSAATGEANAMSMRPVCSPVRTSVTGSTAGDSPSASMARKLMGSPSGTHTFLRRMSSTLLIGSLDSRFANPPSMNPNVTKPACSRPGRELRIERGAHGIDLVERAEQQRNAVEVQAHRSARRDRRP